MPSDESEGLDSWERETGLKSGYVPDMGDCACGAKAEVVVPEANGEHMCYACRDGFLYYEEKRRRS